MQIENIMEKSWNCSTAYHESRTRSYDNSISVVIWLQEAFGLRFKFKIVSTVMKKHGKKSCHGKWAKNGLFFLRIPLFFVKIDYIPNCIIDNYVRRELHIPLANLEREAMFSSWSWY